MSGVAVTLAALFAVSLACAAWLTTTLTRTHWDTRHPVKFAAPRSRRVEQPGPDRSPTVRATLAHWATAALMLGLPVAFGTVIQ